MDSKLILGDAEIPLLPCMMPSTLFFFVFQDGIGIEFLSETCPFNLCRQSFAHACIWLKFHGSIPLLIFPPLPVRSKIVLEPCCSLEVVAHIVVSFCQWGACSPSGNETNAALSVFSLFKWTWASFGLQNARAVHCGLLILEAGRPSGEITSGLGS